MYILSHDPSADMFDLMPYVCPLCGFYHVGHRSKYLAKLSRDSALMETESPHLEQHRGTS